MMSCPVIVIGHVDHGKTSLVRALTGMETDRLPEEKVRGLSIKPGFAHRSIDGVVIDFIDAPGHADFVGAMICGASGAQAALLVISAAEGVRAQTLEHIQIAEALGIRDAVVAVTKSDLLAGTDFQVREAELRAVLRATSFGDAPFIFCSSVTGFGLEALAGALATLARQPRDTIGPSAAFLPIDRVFTAEGHGTIVTGTLLGGPLAAQDELILASTGKTVSIRRMELRGEEAVLAAPGERTALNLRGLPADAIRAGDVLHAPDAFAPSLRIDCVLLAASPARRPVRHMDQVRVLFGSAYATASVRRFGDLHGSPDAPVFLQIRFSTPVCRVCRTALDPAQPVTGRNDGRRDRARSGFARADTRRKLCGWQLSWRRCKAICLRSRRPLQRTAGASRRSAISAGWRGSQSLASAPGLRAIMLT